jgi:predicted RNase H-like HicB family nuclease
MKTYRLDVTVEPLEDGRFLAIASNLEGCIAEGDTVTDAIENLEDGARGIIEYRLKMGWPLPEEFTNSDAVPLVEAKVIVRVGG